MHAGLFSLPQEAQIKNSEHLNELTLLSEISSLKNLDQGFGEVFF